MFCVRLEIPSVRGNTVSFRWSVTPPTRLYFRQEFSLRFPASVDISPVPDGLWWRIALICLHSHWALLRPCRVELPVRLGEGEAEFWMRLVDSEAATLDAHRGENSFHRTIEIFENGDPLPGLPTIPQSRRCVSAFSGGKDSLLQAALLCEILGDPILVATTSEMPPMNEHRTDRRRQIFSEVARLRSVSLVEVESDFRAAWDNGFARHLGYPVWVTEITDVFLYVASLLAVAVARGAPHMFLASENEVQRTSGGADARVIQHTHFMYSVATQRALEAVLRPSGISYTSTTAALRSSQVERLLRARYRDLCNLQYSCPEVRTDGTPCSGCSKCFRAALSSLAANDAPASMGIDLASLLFAMRLWSPPSRKPAGSSHPGQTAQAELGRQVVRYLEEIPFSRIVSALKQGRAGRLAGRDNRNAMAAYARIRRRIFGFPTSEEPGYSSFFLRAADPLVMSCLESIFSEYFPAEKEEAGAAEFARSESLSRWITDPIGGLN